MWYNKSIKNSETVTITKAEYDSLKQIESEFNWLKERQEHSKPLLDAFFAWTKTLGSIAPKSKLGKAVYYLNEEEPYLRRYIEGGSLGIDNNRAERSIKPFVISRKNWLFANTPSGAKASATIFGIIETAKENGLDPYEYLCYVFIKAPNLEFKGIQVHRNSPSVERT